MDQTATHHTLCRRVVLVMYRTVSAPSWLLYQQLCVLPGLLQRIVIDSALGYCREWICGNAATVVLLKLVLTLTGVRPSTLHAACTE
jgi:hypothetical protein